MSNVVQFSTPVAAPAAPAAVSDSRGAHRRRRTSSSDDPDHFGATPLSADGWAVTELARAATACFGNKRAKLLLKHAGVHPATVRTLTGRTVGGLARGLTPSVGHSVPPAEWYSLAQNRFHAPGAPAPDPPGDWTDPEWGAEGGGWAADSGWQPGGSSWDTSRWKDAGWDHSWDPNWTRAQDGTWTKSPAEPWRR